MRLLSTSTIRRPLLRLSTPLVLLCTASTSPDVRGREATLGKLPAWLEAEDVVLAPAVQEKIAAAWECGWREQESEIEALASVISNTSSASDEPTLDLQQLLKDSQNDTESSPEEQREAARGVARTLFAWWRVTSPQKTDEVEQKLKDMDVELENEDTELSSWFENNAVSRETALKQRRRNLQRHARAGTVEYRIFGEVLARDADVLDLLPSAEFETFQGACRQMGAAFNLSGLGEQMESFEEDMQAAEEVENEEFDSFMKNTFNVSEEQMLGRSPDLESFKKDLRALDADYDVEQFAGAEDEGEQLLWALSRKQVAVGEAGFQAWWVPKGIRSFCEAVVEGSGAVQEGLKEPDAACGPWLTVLARLIKRSTSPGFSPAAGGEEAANGFPLLLLLVCLVRQGNLEITAVYTLARALGTLNAQAIAQYEGLDVSLYPDARVSESEGTNTFLPIATEFYQLLEKEFLPYLAVFFAASAFLTFGVPLLLLGFGWWATSTGLQSLVDLVLQQGAYAPDPLDF